MFEFSCPRSCPQAGERWCRFRPILDALGPVRVDSHVAEIDVRITDLNALADACQRIGLEFRWGQKTYRWFGTFVGDAPMPEGMTEDQLGHCLHAIAVPGKLAPYEIGVIQKPNGEYGLFYDYYCGGLGLEDVAGKGLKKLTDEYTVAVAEQQANALGWLHERTVDGSLLIHHPSGGTLTVAPGGTLDATGFVGEGCHTAMLELGLPMNSVTAKPENAQVVARAMTAQGNAH